jgi:L-threonylcarbamoyladenylate synthase
MKDEVQKAASCIQKGGVILYPTDTIWGIGCDATNEKAVQEIYRIKERPDRKSILVLMSGTAMLSRYLEHIPQRAISHIMKSKKPTTLIYFGARNFAPNLPSEDGTIGIRLTKDPFCRKLIEATNRPIVSTSANISGTPAAQSFRDIDPSLIAKVDHVVNWRQEEQISVSPSTIIRFELDGTATVLRP